MTFEINAYPIILGSLSSKTWYLGSNDKTKRVYVLYFKKYNSSIKRLLPIENVSRYLKWRIDFDTSLNLRQKIINTPKLEFLTYNQSKDNYMERHITIQLMSEYINNSRMAGTFARLRKYDARQIVLSCWTISNNFSIKIQRVWRGYIIRKSIKLIVMDMKHKISLLVK